MAGFLTFFWAVTEKHVTVLHNINILTLTFVIRLFKIPAISVYRYIYKTKNNFLDQYDFCLISGITYVLYLILTKFLQR